MMPRAVLLVAILVAGCHSGSKQPRTLRWQLTRGHSLAYRMTAEASAVVDGKDQGARKLSGTLFIDAGDDGEAHIHLESEQPIFGQRAMVLVPGRSSFFFPLPESPLAGEPLAQSFTIKGLGTTATQTNPDIAVSETLEKTADNGELVTLKFSRRGKAAGNTPLDVALESRGKGTFDVKAGRYQRLERTAKLAMSGKLGDQRVDMSMSVAFTLELDLDRSRARTRERATLRASPVSVEELARYLEAHPASAEIAKAVRGFDHGMPTALLAFHLRANPVATWKQALTLPAEKRERFMSGVSFYFGLGRRLPKALVDWLVATLPEHPSLQNAVANMQDERLREQLVSLAALSGPDKELIAKRARDSLRAIDARRKGPRTLLTTDPSRFMELGLAFQAEAQDQRALVPVLIEVLEKAAASPSGSKMPLDDICVQWLEGLTSRSFGKDVEAWKRFWRANKDKPYCRWLIEAAKQDTPALVNNALSRLASCRKFPEATEYLAARVEKDADDTGQLAALSLAEHRDRRAIPALVDMLAGDSPQLRGSALVALASFRDTTLGYEPEGDDAGRAAALRRWRAWARAAPASP